ncbi:MAG TPA: helix-turn-helix domain-containing protein [Alphaproteobacteria bacterium]|nr:helix-turn-helix domain-containing protein [Alphaproteobacteria bacterium]
MVQKLVPRRGRPRAYDPDAALARAMETFWDAGYAATSLDDLSAATGMNRPSLYGAFGDKRALYLETLERYRAAARAALKETLAGDRPLREALRHLYATALALYFSGEHGARGCYLIGTAATEAVLDPAVRAALAEALGEIDAAIEARIRLAQRQGELRADADSAALARLAAAVLHTLALRSRAGEQRAALEATAAAGIDLICGRPAVKPGSRRHLRRREGSS